MKNLDIKETRKTIDFIKQNGYFDIMAVGSLVGACEALLYAVENSVPADPLKTVDTELFSDSVENWDWEVL